MSKNNDNLIIWEKWKDPFGIEDDSIEELLEGLQEYDDEEDEDAIPYEDEVENNTNQNDFEFLANNMPKTKIPMILTPFGIIPYTENTAAGKIFNFWVGHTNFNITDKIASIIEEIPGIETLDVFTRYRFRIGIGKAFTNRNVMHNINTTVYDHLELSNGEKNK